MVCAAWPRAGRQRADAAFQVGQALLEHVGGRVHDAGVDVAQLLQGEQVGRVFGVAELVAGGLVDRHGAAAGGRVGLLAGVQLAGGEAERREMMVDIVNSAPQS